MKRLHPRSGTLIAANDCDWSDTLPADFWQRHTGPAPADEMERRAGFARQTCAADDDDDGIGAIRGCVWAFALEAAALLVIGILAAACVFLG